MMDDSEPTPKRQRLRLSVASAAAPSSAATARPDEQQQQHREIKRGRDWEQISALHAIQTALRAKPSANSIPADVRLQALTLQHSDLSRLRVYDAEQRRFVVPTRPIPSLDVILGIQLQKDAADVKATTVQPSQERPSALQPQEQHPVQHPVQIPTAVATTASTRIRKTVLIGGPSTARVSAIGPSAGT